MGKGRNITEGAKTEVAIDLNILYDYKCIDTLNQNSDIDYM